MTRNKCVQYDVFDIVYMNIGPVDKGFSIYVLVSEGCPISAIDSQSSLALGKDVLWDSRKTVVEPKGGAFYETPLLIVIV